MAAAAAELYAPPLAVLPVAELREDDWTRRRAGHFIANAAMRESVEVSLLTEGFATLKDALDAAAEGSPQAYQMIETNVRTDVFERTIKSGLVMEVDLAVTEDGSLYQHGQTMRSVQANSLEWASGASQMRERTEAETLNLFRMEDAIRSGMLDNYNFVVFSPAADNMTEKELGDAGFFTDTMSCAIQVTHIEDGTIKMESAFVAGKRSRYKERHDLGTLGKLGERMGVNYTGKSATEILATPLLVPKEQMLNGVVDLVALYDQAAGGTFFGEAKPRQNYQDFKQFCEQREAGMQDRIDRITKDLIALAPTLASPSEATQALHTLSEKSMVQHSVLDSSIDPRVFGPAAAHIMKARQLMAAGNLSEAGQALEKAQAVAKSSSCPNGARAMAQSVGELSTSTTSAGEDKYGSLEFKCPKGHRNVRPKNKLLEKCQKCGVSVRC